ncbi:MAG: hypothetical protein ACW981_19285 [Candidatus Hodarchaeales archaeon]|jgi:predicted regulator of Ras-like GTPase activity (Roadblock/LC7/MglB family)
MSKLEKKSKNIDKIFLETKREYESLDLIFCSVIIVINGLSIYNFQKEENSVSKEILSAIAAGAVTTGEFINSKLEINIENKLEFVITGSEGHTTFIKLKSPEPFVLLASGSDNTQIGSTLRFANDFAKEIVHRVF